ncbi:MAG: DUF4843 domain-containing protein [Odoribacteraceae bacterium]|jgi:hypothetical protein|nr:DUF4843 domain-containing protein [Odoribacteraceae bacterium]
MKKYTLIIGVAGALLTACSELEIDRYENDPRLYFYRDISSIGQRDSVSYSFFIQGEAVERDTLWIEVRTMGSPSSAVRPFRVEQANAGDTLAAVGGVHYVSFNSNDLTNLLQVESEAVSAYVPVVLLRDPSLKTQEARLEITIAENEYFKPGIHDNLVFTVKISDFAVKPTGWNATWDFLFKEWGPRKMLFLSEYLDIDFNNMPPSEFDTLLYYAGMAKDMLAKYNKEHPDNPLKEDDGTLVSFD